MEYTSKDIAGKHISKIGLGCVTFGREIDKLASFAMMDYAYERGITFFDTASAYGAGKSEAIIGEWMASNSSISDSILLSTKILPPYNPESVYKTVSQSLSRLGTETIDLLYLHRWDVAMESPEVWHSLANLIAQGKIRMLGASNFTAGQLEKCILFQRESGIPIFRFVQNNNNLAVSDVSDELINLCSAIDILIITYSPLGAGFLTGKHKHSIQSGTRFDIIPGHKDVYFNEKAFSRLARLQEVANRTGISSVHLALAWAMHQPGIDSVLVGGRNPTHIDQAMDAMVFNAPDIFEQLVTDR